MATETQYFVAEFDGEASGPYVAGSVTELTWTGGGRGFIVTLVEDINGASTGKLMVGLIAGAIPSNNDVLTQGSTTGNTSGPLANGDASVMLYPAFFREDVSKAAGGALAWTGPALGSTHSFLWDGQTANVVVGEILTFSPGNQQCEVVTIVSDAGASGEFEVRWVTNMDTFEFPDDNDTFTGDIAGDGTLNGVIHDRCYSALHLHRLLSDLSDDPIHAGDDVLSTYKATPSQKDTDTIVNLLGTVTITDVIAQHMFGGSVSQTGGDTLYSGWNIQITDSDGLTAPVLIVDDAIKTDYWSNAFMPDSVDGRIRILQKTRDDGVDVDGKRVKGKLLRFNDSYFFSGTTLGLATTAQALFSTPDGNNATAEGTVAGYTIATVEGYQTIDYNNGNGAQPFSLKIDFSASTSLEAYERTKYNQREGTAETLYGRNAQLFDGVTLNFTYDGEVGTFTEDEIVAWGTELPYTGETGGPWTAGEVVVGGTSGAKGRLVYIDDNGTTGTLLVDVDGATGFNNTETITGQTSGATATTGTVVSNATAGRAQLLALEDAGASVGDLYMQSLIGLVPSDGQTVFGESSNATGDVDGSVSTRGINNQYVGVYTGTNYQTNFGVGVDVTDAIAGDLLRDLLNVQQQPPNNQTGLITGLESDYYITCYPFDGSTLDAAGDPEPNFDEMTLSVALVAASSTTVVVQSAEIPDNTPGAGFLRIERDSDNEYDLLEYVSHDSDDTFTLGGSTPTAPSAAGTSNNVFRALIDGLAGGTSISYTAVVGASEQVAITARRGGTVAPIKPAKATSTFSSTGFSVNLQPQSDA